MTVLAVASLLAQSLVAEELPSVGAFETIIARDPSRLDELVTKLADGESWVEDFDADIKRDNAKLAHLSDSLAGLVQNQDFGEPFEYVLKELKDWHAGVARMKTLISLMHKVISKHKDPNYPKVKRALGNLQNYEEYLDHLEGRLSALIQGAHQAAPAARAVGDRQASAESLEFDDDSPTDSADDDFAEFDGDSPARDSNTQASSGGSVDSAVSTVQAGYGQLGSKLVNEGANAVVGVPGALWSLVTNFPLHLELGVSLFSGAFQQGARYNEYLIRGPGYAEPKLELTLGLEFTRLILAFYADVGASLNTRMKDTEALKGFSIAPGLVLNTGAKVLYRVDRKGHLAGGLFAGYYQHLTNVRDKDYNDLLGRGFLVGGLVRWKPVKLIALNGKLGAGPEWMRTKDPNDKDIRGTGAVVMASLGISFSWHNEYEEGSYPKAIKTIAKGAIAATAGAIGLGISKAQEAQATKQALEQAVSETAQHVAEEASGTTAHQPASGTAVHQPASGTSTHQPAASRTVQHNNAPEKTVEEESAAQPDSSNTNEAESASQPAPSDEEKDKPQSFRVQMLAAVNAQRAKKGLDPLKWNYLLEAAAEVHAQDMVSHPPLFGHVGSDGSRVKHRVKRQGYDHAKVGENVAQGQRSIEQVMSGWMNSPPHRENILHPGFTEIGVVRIKDTWVQVFGTPAGPVPNS